MRSSIRAGERDREYLIIMDSKINTLRREIWKTTFVKNKELMLSDCDVAMALGMVMYELLHHSNPEDPRNISVSK